MKSLCPPPPPLRAPHALGSEFQEASGLGDAGEAGSSSTRRCRQECRAQGPPGRSWAEAAKAVGSGRHRAGQGAPLRQRPNAGHVTSASGTRSSPVLWSPLSSTRTPRSLCAGLPDAPQATVPVPPPSRKASYMHIWAGGPAPRASCGAYRWQSLWALWAGTGCPQPSPNARVVEKRPQPRV